MRGRIGLTILLLTLSIGLSYAKGVDLRQVSSEYIELRYEKNYSEKAGVYIIYDKGEGYIKNEKNKRIRFKSFIELNLFLEDHGYTLVSLYIKGFEAREYVMVYKKRNLNFKKNSTNVKIYI